MHTTNTAYIMLAKFILDLMLRFDMRTSELERLPRNKVEAIKHLRMLVSMPAEVRRIARELPAGYQVVRVIESMTPNTEALPYLGLIDAKELVEAVEALHAAGKWYILLEEIRQYENNYEDDPETPECD